MGTAAYMAPELTSLIDFAAEFPVQCEKELRLNKKVLPFGADKETKELALQHAAAIEQFDLSSTPRPKPRPESQASNSSSSSVHTPRDLAPKVRPSTRFRIIIRELISSVKALGGRSCRGFCGVCNSFSRHT